MAKFDTIAARSALDRHARQALGAARPHGGNALTDAGGDKTLNKLWKLQSVVDLSERALNIAQALTEQMPSWQHAITVSVIGGPHADMRRVWYLCCSAAFGRYRERIRTAFNQISLSAVWDITGKACALQIVHQNNQARDGANRLLASVGARSVLTVFDSIIPQEIRDQITQGAQFQVGGINIARSYRKALDAAAAQLAVESRDNFATFLHRGPEQLTIGGSWPEFLRPAGFRTRPQAYTPEIWFVKVQCRGSTDETINAMPVTFVGRVGALREYPDVVNNSFRFYPYRVQAPRRAFGVAAGLVRAGSNIQLGLPTLPDDGRIITTPEKDDPFIQPPSPPLDGTSRCSLVQLVAQALDEPCHLPSSVPCTETPAASSGVWVYPPGSTLGEVEYTSDDPNLHAYRSTVNGRKDTVNRTTPNPSDTADGIQFTTGQEDFRGG